jgi:apolipoprotein D and lipocalin family protein
MCMKKIWLAIALAAAFSAGCASTPHAGDMLKTAEQVNLEHFMGRWYVVSSLPNSAEQGRVGPYVEFAQLNDHRIDQTYYFHQGDFDHPLQKKQDIATVVDTQSNAIWKTRFGEALFADFSILYVDPEYRYALIGRASRDYAWILARDRYIGDDDYQQLILALSAQGFDPTRVMKIPPREEFIGIPGYQ